MISTTISIGSGVTASGSDARRDEMRPTFANGYGRVSRPAGGLRLDPRKRATFAPRAGSDVRRVETPRASSFECRVPKAGPHAAAGRAPMFPVTLPTRVSSSPPDRLSR